MNENRRCRPETRGRQVSEKTECNDEPTVKKRNGDRNAREFSRFINVTHAPFFITKTLRSERNFCFRDLDDNFYEIKINGLRAGIGNELPGSKLRESNPQ